MSPSKTVSIRILSKETDEAYLGEVIKVAVNPDCVKQVADEFKLVYTPFHGAGYRLVPEILRRLGYKHIICEPEQMKIDGDFPTVKNPNPEYKEGFTLAIELAKQNDVDRSSAPTRTPTVPASSSRTSPTSMSPCPAIRSACCSPITSSPQRS